MTNSRELLDQLIRRQRSRLTAQLVKRCGYELLPLIEDAIQDAILKALEKWEYEGLPDNAAAWLYRVAYNRAIDLLRKKAPEIHYQPELDHRFETVQADAELQLLQYCCHPELSPLEQQLLMLNLVIGLDYSELATLTLGSKQAIAQRLARLKRKTRGHQNIQPADQADWDEANLESLITTLYTAFNVGYFPRQGDELIRKDVAFEALRLSCVLVDECPVHLKIRSRLAALSALLSFQCSRFSARENEAGQPLLLHEQDPKLWDHDLINQAETFLSLARQSNGVSDLHIEAAIAAIHCQTSGNKNWQTIAQLYDSLIELSPSPGRVIGASIAHSLADQNTVALRLLIDLERDSHVQSYTPFHLAKAEVLNKLGRFEEAKEALREASKTSSSAPIVTLIENRII